MAKKIFIVLPFSKKWSGFMEMRIVFFVGMIFGSLAAEENPDFVSCPSSEIEASSSFEEKKEEILPAFSRDLTNPANSSLKKSRFSHPFYDSVSPIEVDISLGLDDFRSLPEGSWEGNFGAFSSVNLTAPLPCSFFLQLAGSYGLYDWAGRSSTPFKNSKTLQQQGFITIAASHQTLRPCGWNAGLAYDWMLNKNFGLFAVNPFFDQIRAQGGYLFRGGNELGALFSYGIHTSNLESQQIPLQFRGISQVSLFWCHYFKSKGYGMLWLGTPYRRGLLYSSGRPGTFLVGAQFAIPVTHSLSIDGSGVYMGARGRAGINSSKNYASNLSFGITYSFGKRRVIKTPYMTLANNSNFLSDTSQNL